MLIERAGVREAPRLHLGGCQEVVPPPERRRGISPPAVRGTVVERRLRVVSPVVVLHPLLHMCPAQLAALKHRTRHLPGAQTAIDEASSWNCKPVLQLQTNASAAPGSWFEGG